MTQQSFVKQLHSAELHVMEHEIALSQPEMSLIQQQRERKRFVHMTHKTDQIAALDKLGTIRRMSMEVPRSHVAFHHGRGSLENTLYGMKLQSEPVTMRDYLEVDMAHLPYQLQGLKAPGIHQRLSLEAGLPLVTRVMVELTVEEAEEAVMRGLMPARVVEETLRPTVKKASEYRPEKVFAGKPKGPVERVLAQREEYVRKGRKILAKRA